MLKVTKMLALAAFIAVSGTPVSAQQRYPAVAPAPLPPYPVYADLVLASPVIVDAAVRSTTRIKGAEAANVAPGSVRFYVEADVVALIRGPQALPPRIGFVADVPLDSRGKVPNLKKLRVLLFARPVSGNIAQIQLVHPDSMRPWSPPTDELTRRITKEVVATDAPPQIVGFGNAFHVPGTLPGEGETQIFLTTPDNRPVSLSIVRRPGEAQRWGVSLSDVVDEGAAAPARDTLLWYRLACALPPELPAKAMASAEPADADVAREDYRFVITSLGPCDRGTG